MVQFTYTAVAEWFRHGLDKAGRNPTLVRNQLAVPKFNASLAQRQSTSFTRMGSGFQNSHDVPNRRMIWKVTDLVLKAMAMPLT